MKYGLAFFTLGAFVAWIAIQNSDWFLILLWPAADCAAIAVAYVAAFPQLFGKRSDGRLNPLTLSFMLPYLCFLWTVWHVLRLVQSENAYDELDERFTIGRRLLPSEMPPDIQNVIDLTCEFSEPAEIANDFNYLSFPILDASVPLMPEFQRFVESINSLSGRSFIHCAQGHGRTGLLTAAILIYQTPSMSVDTAIKQITSARPALRCNEEQLRFLRKFAAMQRVQ